MNKTWALFLALALGSCTPETTSEVPESPEAAVEQATLPIVGGDTETGFPGVCALTAVQVGLGYAGPFCSCTVIAPNWILTAAHCVTAMPADGFYPTAVLTRLFIGSDARPNGTKGPMEGKTYMVDKLIPHPKYNPQKTENDIALVHLAEPVQDVEPMAYKATALQVSEVVGKEILYVGFGVTNGINKQGAGVKRSVHVKMKSLADKSYMSQEYGVGVCFGDSGGPGIFEAADGTKTVIGVNSTVFGMGQDPCGGNSFQTRVDVFAQWITNYLISPPPSCQKDATMCWCPEGCQSNGACDNSVCQTLSCQRVYDCFRACADDDAACKQDCYLRATDGGRERFHDLMMCRMLMCSTKADSEMDSCLRISCPAQTDACVPIKAGFANCRELHDCIGKCDLNDDACQLACYNNSTVEARETYNELWNCSLRECQTSEVGYWPTASCLWEKCAYGMDTCFASSGCSMLGGSCPAGMACGVTPMGRQDCFPSLEGKDEAVCGAAPDQPLPCDDGLVCSTVPYEQTASPLAEGETQGACLRVCARAEDCESGETCDLVDGVVAEGLGVCRCSDADGDGFCGASDCDDQDADANPDAPEACDGKDNNCDGQVDEGCSAPEEGRADEAAGESDAGGGSCSAGGQASTSALALVVMALVVLAGVRRTRRCLTR